MRWKEENSCTCTMFLILRSAVGMSRSRKLCSPGTGSGFYTLCILRRTSSLSMIPQYFRLRNTSTPEVRRDLMVSKRRNNWWVESNHLGLRFKGWALPVQRSRPSAQTLRDPHVFFLNDLKRSRSEPPWRPHIITRISHYLPL